MRYVRLPLEMRLPKQEANDVDTQDSFDFKLSNQITDGHSERRWPVGSGLRADSYKIGGSGDEEWMGLRL
jgi:hypothetical protein